MFRKKLLSFTILAIVSFFSTDVRAAEADPELVEIHITKDTLIDGEGSSHCNRFIIEDNTYLTIRSALLKNVDRTTFVFKGPNSKLVLQNVTLELYEDIIFNQGSVVIGEVKFSRSKDAFGENPTVWIKPERSIFYIGDLYLDNVDFRHIEERVVVSR